MQVGGVQNALREDRELSIPGGNPQHVAVINTYRCVYSHTYFPGASAWCRHLSVSVPGDHYPSPFAMWTIATDLFGFAGWEGHSLEPPDDWGFVVNKEEHCIGLAQELPREQWP